MRPRSSPRGISWWMMPLPAVIHCTSPPADGARVAQRVGVIDLALEHVGDGLDAAMGMPGESRRVESRVVAAEVVEHQEGVEKGLLAGAEGPAQMYPGALYGRPAGLGHALDLPYPVHGGAIPSLRAERNPLAAARRQ